MSSWDERNYLEKLERCSGSKWIKAPSGLNVALAAVNSSKLSVSSIKFVRLLLKALTTAAVLGVGFGVVGGLAGWIGTGQVVAFIIVGGIAAPAAGALFLIVSNDVLPDHQDELARAESTYNKLLEESLI